MYLTNDHLFFSRSFIRPTVVKHIALRRLADSRFQICKLNQAMKQSKQNDHTVKKPKKYDPQHVSLVRELERQTFE